MHIIVIGAGKIGHEIIDTLEKEGHNLSVIDSKSDAASEFESQVKFIVGDGLHNDTLLAADIATANILIATTGKDEVNILACMSAHLMNPNVKTIARVRDPLYSQQIRNNAQEYHIDIVTSPDELAARSIIDNLALAGALKVEQFEESALLVDIRVPHTFKYLNQPLSVISVAARETGEYEDQSDAFNMLVALVSHDDDVFTPNGSYEVKENDKLSILVAEQDVAKMLEFFDLTQKPIKNCCIIGGGKITAELLRQFGNKIHTTVIDRDLSVCESIRKQFDSISLDVLHQDATLPKVLDDLGDFDSLVALTGIDEENILISAYMNSLHLKNNDHLRKIITKINRNSLQHVFERVGINTCISPKELLSNEILSYVRNLALNEREIVSFRKIADGKAIAVEFAINEEIKNITNIAIKDLGPKLKKGVLIAAILRYDANNNLSVIIPSGANMIRLQDRVVLVYKNDMNDKIHTLKDILR